jgi:hypothetical protein
MYRLGHLVDGKWLAYDHPAVFDSGERITAGVSNRGTVIFARMVECLEPPYHLLYVLHTPRGEGPPGRYQSPALSLADVKAFLTQFDPFFSADARFDLWAHSPGDHGTIVWDRHDMLFAYGPLERYTTVLLSLGFMTGKPSVPAPHEHHYRAEFDPLAKHLLTVFNWSYSPLRPEDAQ